MKKGFSVIAVFLSLCLFAGCTTTGNKVLRDETQESLAEKFEVGVTSKDEVVDLLGAPMETTFTDDGLLMFKYSYARFTPKARNFIPYNFISLGQDSKEKELVILFDENDVIKRFVLNETESETRSGVVE